MQGLINQITQLYASYLESNKTPGQFSKENNMDYELVYILLTCGKNLQHAQLQQDKKKTKL